MDPSVIFPLICFDTFPSDSITGALTLADSQIGANLCPDLRPQMVAYLAAHILTIAGRKLGASGDVAALAEGKLSITYSNSTADIKSGLSKTIYGQEFERLSRACTFTPRTRVNTIYGCYC